MRQVAKKGLITAVATGGVIAVTGGYAYADATAAGTGAGSPGVLSGNTVQVPVHVPVNACGNTVDVIGLLNPAFGNSCANGSGGGAAGGGGATARGTSAGSPGVLSGNTVQAPVHVPVNVCGNSVNAVGALNPAFGNRCANGGATGGTTGGGATAGGGATGSPGVGSGNTVQVPVHVPVNACGNTVDVVGLLNPAFGNGCGNGGTVPVPVVGPPTVPTGPGTPPVTRTPPTRTVPPRSTPPAHGHLPARHARPPMGGQTLAHTGVAQLGLIGGAGAAALAGGFALYRRGRAMRG